MAAVVVVIDLCESGSKDDRLIARRPGGEDRGTRIGCEVGGGDGVTCIVHPNPTVKRRLAILRGQSSSQGEYQPQGHRSKVELRASHQNSLLLGGDSEHTKMMARSSPFWEGISAN